MQTNYKVKIIDPSKDPRWDSFVLEQKHSTIYHHSVWKELLEKTFKHMKSMYFILEDNKNKIVGGIPLFLVKSWLTGNRLASVPFASECVPLVSRLEDFEVLAGAIIDKLSKHQCSYLEMKIKDDSELLNISMLKKLCYSKSHVLSLDKDLDTLKKSFSKTAVQRMIKRAERVGLTVETGSSEEDMKTFFGQFILQRVKRFGLPPHPYIFFKNMWKLLYPKNMLTLQLIKHDGKTISGVLLLKFNHTVLLEHGVLDSQYLKDGVNPFFWWKAIELSHKEGFQFVGFGQSHLDDKGLIEFKRRWRMNEYNLFHLYFPDIKGVYSSRHEGLKDHLIGSLIRHCPLPVAQLGGNFLYKHMG
jgi:hypothetical protein